jgi:hypothetical protein
MLTDRRLFLGSAATGALLLGCSREYQELGEQFEAKETSMLGDHGFEKAVEEVSRLEQAVGVDDLAKLTA